MKAALLLLLCLLSQASACLWDRDTLAHEAAGNMNVVHTAVGWFDRNPELYYQMRLDRLSKELEAGTDDLSLYDDAAVAADRLGKSDEAIKWMKEKAKRIPKMASDIERLEQQYRYHANLGTFYAHRWIHQSPESRKADLSDLARAELEISRAIEINEEAHFGREKYQLAVIKWLRGPYVTHKFLLGHCPLPGISDEDSENATVGLCGLVQLGAAWRSPDVYRMICYYVSNQSAGALASLTYQRVKELNGNQPHTLHPGWDEDSQAGLIIRPKSEEGEYYAQEPEDLKKVINFYKQARQAAHQRHLERTEYMLAKLEAGEHPDTHRDFWNGWKSPTFPKIPGRPANVRK